MCVCDDGVSYIQKWREGIPNIEHTEKKQESKCVGMEHEKDNVVFRANNSCFFSCLLMVFTSISSVGIRQ